MPVVKKLIFGGATVGTVAALAAATVISMRDPPTPPAKPALVATSTTSAIRSIAWRSLPNARDKLEVDYTLAGDRGGPTYIDVSAKDVPVFTAVLEWAEAAGRRSRQGAVATFLVREIVGGRGYGQLRIGIDLTALGVHETASPLVVQVEKLPQKTRKLVEDVDVAAFQAARADLDRRTEDEKRRAGTGGK